MLLCKVDSHSTGIHGLHEALVYRQSMHARFHCNVHPRIDHIPCPAVPAAQSAFCRL